MQVAFIPSKEGGYPGEGMQALSIDTSDWSGDILVTNNEICRGTAGFGGMNIYDISNPSRPVPLAVRVGDSDVQGNKKKTANQIHSVVARDAGDRAYAVMVDNEEALDVDIMDVTNPKKPVLVAEYELAAQLPGDPPGRTREPHRGLPSRHGRQGDRRSLLHVSCRTGTPATSCEGKLSEVDTYAIPEAMDPAFSTGYGDLSVHEMASSHQGDDLAYLAYYSGGLRVITVGPEGITEVAAFIDEGGNNFWGVEVFERDGVEYAALSDRDFGLYIFRYASSD